MRRTRRGCTRRRCSRWSTRPRGPRPHTPERRSAEAGGDRPAQGRPKLPVSSELVPRLCLPIRHYVKVVTDTNDLLPLLRERLVGIYSPPLAGTRASLLSPAGGRAKWTVYREEGRPRARRGGPPRPTTSVRAALPVLTDV